MHKVYAQLQGINIFNFEGWGFHALYFLLELDVNNGEDLYFIEIDLGYDVNDTNPMNHYCVGNNYFGCSKDGFDNGDGEYDIDYFTLETEDYA